MGEKEGEREEGGRRERGRLTHYRTQAFPPRPLHRKVWRKQVQLKSVHLNLQ